MYSSLDQRRFNNAFLSRELLSAAIVVWLAAAPPVGGQPAYVLDPTFSPVITRPGGWVNGLMVQSDGKIYVNGRFDAIHGIPRHGIGRLNADGSLDESFADSVFGDGETREIHALAVQNDGKVIVGVAWDYSDQRTAVLRLHPDGRWDPEFQQGARIRGVPGFIAIQGDSRVLLVWNSEHGRINARSTINRLNSSGGLDGTFLQTDFDGSGVPVKGLTVQPDGRTVVWGCFTHVNGAKHSGLARLNSDGSLDPSFRLDLTPAPCIRDVALLENGKLMIAGDLASPTIVRLNSDGSLDPSFNLRSSGARVWANQLVVLPNGLVITPATVGDVSRLVRLTNDGSLDTSFNATPAEGVWEMLSMSPDGGIIGLRFHDRSGAGQAISKLKADGDADPVFAGASVGVSSKVGSAVQQPDGKWVISGEFDRVNGIPSPGLARLNADGSVDETFAPDAEVPNTCGKFECFDLLRLQADGRLLVGGVYQEREDGSSTVTLRRLNPDGSRDASFSSALVDSVLDLELVAVGKLLVASRPRESDDSRLVRLNEDGTVDASYALREPLAVIQSIRAAPNGKVLVVANRRRPDGRVGNSELVRLAGDGTLNPEFTPQPAYGKIALLPDNRLLVFDGDRLWRLNANGIRDSTFGRIAEGGGVPVDGAVGVLSLADGRILLFGLIRRVNYEPLIGDDSGSEDWTSLVLLDAQGNRDRAFGLWRHTGGTCYSHLGVAADLDGSLLLMDCFTQLNSARRWGLARLKLAPVFRAPWLGGKPRFSAELGVVPGRGYRVEASADLANWTTLTTFTSASEVFPFTDPDPVTAQRFYRAIEVGP